MIISKELLSKVLGIDVKLYPDVDSINIECSKVNYSYLEGGHIKKCINIHELGHKCKEWAFTKHNRYLKSYPHKSYDGKITYTCAIISQSGMNIGMFPGSLSEPEAIFKACQWILEQKATT